MEGDPQIRLRFVTRDASLRVSDTAFAVPESIDSKGLSEVVAHLLERESGSLRLEFLVGGEILRGAIGDCVRRREELSVEEVVEVEYFPALPPPEEGPSRDGPDWVSCIGASESLAVAGFFDGTLLMHRLEGGELEERAFVGVRAHMRSIGAVSVGSGVGVDKQVVVTGGKDCVVKCWTVLDDIECVGIGAGHEGSITTAAIAPGLQAAATGAWDGGLCVWSLPDVTESKPKTRSGRRRRKSGSGEDGGSGGGEGNGEGGVAELKMEWEEKSLLVGAITGLVWRGAEELVTGAMDHSVRLWEVKEGGGLAASSARHAHAAVLDVTLAPSHSVVASAHSDELVRIWDFRTHASSSSSSSSAAAAAPITSTPVLTLRGAKSWVTRVEWSPEQEHVLASTAQDGRVLLWDTRSPSLPLHTATKHDGKALALAFPTDALILSGGEDRTIRAATIA